jgi:hypothetical protein
MKQGSNSRRARGRGNGRRHSRNQNFDSNGPDVRVRGNAQQVLDKYLILARDALSAGDRISSENYFQHAEHYHRILHSGEDGNGEGRRDRRPHSMNDNGGGFDSDDGEGDGDGYDTQDQVEPMSASAPQPEIASEEPVAEIGEEEQVSGTEPASA